jgi:predicted acetyltransferase
VEVLQTSALPLGYAAMSQLSTIPKLRLSEVGFAKIQWIFSKNRSQLSVPAEGVKEFCAIDKQSLL